MAREEIRIDITADDDASRLIEQVAADAEALDSSVIEIPVDADTTGATAGMKNLADKSDQTRSVMANMAGNATQDLAAIGGVAGTAGVALGQLGEYATDGNIQLGELAKAAGPMIAVGLATKVIADHMAKVAAADAFSKKKVEDWVDALREGKSLTEAMADAYREAGKVEVEWGDDVVDVTRILGDAGITVEQFAELTQMSAGEMDAWGAEMVAAGGNLESLQNVMFFAAQEADDVAHAEENAAAATRVFGGEAKQTASDVRSLEDSYRSLNDELSDRSALLDLADGWAALKEAGDAAFLAAVTGSADAEQAARDYQRAIIDQQQAVSDYGAEVAGLPPQQVTQIQALIDQGKFDEAQYMLALLEGQRTVFVDLKKGSGWNDQALFNAWAQIPRGASTNVTVNVPKGTRADDVIAAAHRYGRRNGGRGL